MSLQEALRLMRLELGMAQTDLAKKLNKAFITVSRWENGKGFPSRENAKKILDIAKNGPVSQECYAYLDEMLMPGVRRSKSAAAYGFPQIDRDFLFQLADASTNALYVVEAGTYRLLYANRKAEKFAEEYLAFLGEDLFEKRQAADRRCFHYFANKTAPCSFCPLQKAGREIYRDQTVFLPNLEQTVCIRAKSVKMKNRDVYALYVTDITEKHAEQTALYELTHDIPDSVGIYHVYADHRIELTFMNQAFGRSIGAAHREALPQDGAFHLSLIHPDDRVRLEGEIRSSVAEQRPIRILLRIRLEDGAFHSVRLHGKLLKRETERLTIYCRFHRMEEGYSSLTSTCAEENRE